MFSLRKIGIGAAVLVLGFALQNTAKAAQVEVLHWWTSGGEAKALSVLKEQLEAKGIEWLDMPVAGGSGDAARTTLKARVAAGDPPAASQTHSYGILDWAKTGKLADLDDVASAEGWDDVVPATLQAYGKVDGSWVAVPVNVHSTNWVWANKAVLDEVGVGVPADWEEFVDSLQKVQDSGLVAFAHGGQPWQDATVFEAVALATGGPAFYRSAFIDLDEDALGSDTMKVVFDRMSQLRGFVDDSFSGREWNLASAMVINGEAAFQIMGDWAKGEFTSAGKEPGVDFLCFRVPGSENSVTVLSDWFVMFAVDESKRGAQAEMARDILSPGFQVAFNTVKGSAPARTDVDDSAFDVCGKKAIADIQRASPEGGVVGSFAHGMIPDSVKGAFIDVVTSHFNGGLTSEEAAAALVVAKQNSI